MAKQDTTLDGLPIIKKSENTTDSGLPVLKKKESTTSPSLDTTSPSPSAKFDPTKFVTLPTGQDFQRPEDKYEDPTGGNRKVPPKKEKIVRPLPPSKPVTPVTNLQEAIENAPESQTQEILSETPSNVTTTQPKEEGQIKSLPKSQQPYAGSGNEGEGVGFLPSAIAGAISMTADTLKGALRIGAELSGNTKGMSEDDIQKKLEDYALYKLINAFGEYGEQSPYSPVGISEKLGQAAGSLVPFIFGSAVSAPFKIGKWVTPAIMGATSNAESNYREAINNGATPDEAIEVFWKALPAGTLEMLPLMNWGKRINALTKGRLNSYFADALKRNTAGQGTLNALGEGFGEAMTDILNNAVHKDVYDETRSLLDGAFESGMIGFVLGKGVDAVVSTLEKRRNSQPLTPAEKVAYDQAITYAKKKAAILEGTNDEDLVADPITSPEIQELSNTKFQLETDLMNPEIDDAVKEQIGEKINEVDAQIEAAKADVVEQDRQVVETQGAIAELESQKDDLQSQIDNSSPATQEILMPQMDEILSNLEQLKETLPNKSVYDEFIDTGNVPNEILEDIATKVQNRQQLTDEENAIFSGKTKEINQILVNRKESQSETPLTNVEEKTEPTIGQEVLSEQPPISTQNVPLTNEVNIQESVAPQGMEVSEKVETAQPIAPKKELTPEQKTSKTERLLSLKGTYNSIPKNHTRKRKDVMDNIRALSSELGYTITESKGKIDVLNDKGKKVYRQKSVAENPIEERSPEFQAFYQKIKGGLKSWDTSVESMKIDVGLSQNDINRAVDDLAKGKHNTNTQKLLDGLEKMHDEGYVDFVLGGGNQVTRTSVKIDDYFSKIQEDEDVLANLTDEEIDEIENEIIKNINEKGEVDWDKVNEAFAESVIKETIKQYEQERVLSDNDTKTEKGQPTESDKPIEGEKGKSKQGFTEGETLAKESGFDKVIDFLENLKADNTNKLNAFGILPEVWNAAISGLQAALKAGKSVTEALDSFIKELKDNGQTFDEKQVRDVVQGAIEKGMQTKPKTTEKVEEKKEDEQVAKVKTREKSLFKRAYEGTPDDEMKSLISEYGLNYEIESHDKAQQAAKDFVQEVGPEEALEAVRKNMIEDGAAAFVWAEIIDKVEIELSTESNPENISKLQKYQRDLIDEFDRKARSGGRFISALQRIYRDSLFNYKADVQIERYKAVNNGEIPSDIEQKFRDLENQLKEVNEKLKEAEIAAEKAREELAIANIKESVERENKAKKSPKQKAKEIANAIRKGKTNRPNIFMSSSPAAIVWDGAVEAVAKAIEAGGSIAESLSKGLEYIKNSKWYKDLSEDKKSEAESTFKQYIKDNDPNKINVEVIDGKIKIPHKLIRQKVSEGITDPEALAQSVLDDIKSEYPDLTIRQVRDAISNYGKTVNPSQDEVEIKIRKIKRIQRIISALEDVSAKKRPLRSGQQRDKLDAEERAKMKELREAMKELPLDEETQAKQLKTALDAVKSRLKNAIEDIQRQIETGERSPKKGTIEYDQEAKDLLAEKERLQALRDEIFGKPELTTEQKIDRATKGLDRSIRELERRIDEKDFSSPIKEPISSPEIEIRKARQKLLRGQLQALREEIGVAEQKRLEIAKKRAESQIAELERRLREKDFSKKQKKTTKEDEELGELRAKKVRIQQEFEKEQYKNELKNRNAWAKISDILLELVNIPRALRATAEMSPVLIQGGVQTISQLARNPKSVIRAFTELGKGWWSESKANEWMNKLIASKEYPAMEQAGLSISKPNAKLAAREELYLSGLINTLWDKIGLPLKVLGEKPYDLWKAANPFMKFERAGTAYLNTLRVERFVQGMRMLEIQGKSPSTHPQEYKALAKVINTLTGRTSLGKAETIAKPLSLIFFSPRNLASTLKQATFLPLMAEGRNKDGTIKPSVAQKIAFTDFMTYMIAVGGIVAMIKNAYEDDDEKDAPKVNTDPRSSEFMTIKIGNSVIDPWHGLKQYVVLAARLYTGQTVNAKGDVKELGSGPYIPTEGKLLYRTLFQYKLSPTASMLEKYWTAPRKKINGEYVKVDEFTKQPLNMLDQTTQNLYPIYWDTFSEVNKENPTEVAAFLNTLAFFGIGLNVYDSENTKNKKQNTAIPKGVILFKPPK